MGWYAYRVPMGWGKAFRLVGRQFWQLYERDVLTTVAARAPGTPGAIDQVDHLLLLADSFNGHISVYLRMKDRFLDKRWVPNGVRVYPGDIQEAIEGPETKDWDGDEDLPPKRARISARRTAKVEAEYCEALIQAAEDVGLFSRAGLADLEVRCHSYDLDSPPFLQRKLGEVVAMGATEIARENRPRMSR